MARKLHLPESGVGVDRLHGDLRQRDVDVPAAVVRPVAAGHERQSVGRDVGADLRPAHELRKLDRRAVGAGDLDRDARPLHDVGAEGGKGADDLGAELIADLLDARVRERSVELDGELTSARPVGEPDDRRRCRRHLARGCGGACGGVHGHRLYRRLDGDGGRREGGDRPGHRTDARQHGLDQTVLVVEIKTANDHEGACEGNQPQPKAPFLPLDTVRVAAVKLAKCSTGSEIVKEKIHRGSENI